MTKVKTPNVFWGTQDALPVEILSPSLRGLGSIKLAWRGWLTELVGLPNLLYPFVAGLIGGMRL